MNRSISLMLAGALGGALTWVLREPTAPRTFADAAWSRWEVGTGLVLGLLIGAFLGAMSGHLQGSRTHLVRGVLIGVVLGAISGSIGITLGSAIFSAGAGIPLLGELFRAAGWAIMGGLIGLGMGVNPWSPKRAMYGLMGGLIGGGIGGMAFTFVAGVTSVATVAVQGGNETGTLARAVGFTIVGAGIGLLIGVVEALARQAWVRLVVGRNEGKEWAMFDSHFVIGRSESAHAPLLGDPNVAAQHAVIQKQGGEYVIGVIPPVTSILVNGQHVQGAALASGDTFQIGSHMLQFLVRGTKVQRVTDQARAAIRPMQPITVPGGQPVGPASMVAPVVPQATSTPGVVALDGPLAGQRFAVTGSVELGRETGPIPLGFDSRTSRRHAALQPVAGGLMVTDLGSTNGVWVAGTKITSQLVRNGETFQVGSTTFRVENL